nr:MAG TPA: hypothetical protein [Caudoviricetes sp.]
MFFSCMGPNPCFFSASIRTHSPPFHAFSMFFRKVCVGKVYIFLGKGISYTPR